MPRKMVQEETDKWESQKESAAPAVDHQAELESLRAKVLAAAEEIERDLASRWGEEKFNDGARAAAQVVRAILA